MTTMVFAFFCFTGVFVMFYYIVRSLEKFQEQTRNEHAQLRVQIRALEARLDTLAGAPPPVCAPPPDKPQDLLELSPKNLDSALDDPLMRFEPKRSV